MTIHIVGIPPISSEAATAGRFAALIENVQVGFLVVFAATPFPGADDAMDSGLGAFRLRVSIRGWHTGWLARSR